jgi:hypothetical protein
MSDVDLTLFFTSSAAFNRPCRTRMVSPSTTLRYLTVLSFLSLNISPARRYLSTKLAEHGAIWFLIWELVRWDIALPQG